MPVPTDITAGTISISGSTVTGVGTSFEASDIRQGDLFIWIEGGEGQWSPIVQTVTSNTVLTLAEPWTGPTISGARYRLRYQWDSSRVSAQSRQLIEMLDNGNVLALAGLTGPGVPVFDGPHSMTVQPVQDFVNGVAYNVQVDTLADRAAYDGQTAGFAVLVSDVGDGRSAIYSKASNASGDWTDPAYVTGPIGPSPIITAEVTTTSPGSTAGVTVTPITGGYDLAFDIPAAEGFYNAGVYNPANAYTTDQVVRYNGSSFIALQAVPSGTSPSSAFPPVDTAFWQVLAAKGQDGSGTGDVMGPATSINDQFVAFNGTTGKLIKAAPYTPVNRAGDQFTGDVGFGVAPVVNKGAIQSRKAVTAGPPASTGTSDPAQFASFGAATLAELDLGIRATTNNVWAQARDPANFATARNLELNPSGGQVLMPAKVSFWAIAPNAAAGGAYMTNYIVGHNVGSAFNPTSGFFTAPVSGLYSFSFGALNQNAAAILRIRLAVNAVERTPSLFTVAANAHLSGSAQYLLSAGDAVGVFVNAGLTFADSTPWGYNFFFGYLIG